MEDFTGKVMFVGPGRMSREFLGTMGEGGEKTFQVRAPVRAGVRWEGE